MSLASGGRCRKYPVWGSRVSSGWFRGGRVPRMERVRALQEHPDTVTESNADSRRMTWPDAVALLAIASVVCWIVIASVFLGITLDTNTVADERDIQDMLEFAPAAGPAEGQPLASDGAAPKP